MTRRRALVTLIALLALAYLGLLQVRANDREPPLVVTWTAGIVEKTVVHPRTGLAGWAVRADVDALLERVASARGWRATHHLAADATALSLRVEEVRGHRVALVESPPQSLGELPARLAAAGPVALVVLATTAAPADALGVVGGPLAVLPGAYGDGVPDGGEASAEARLVAPWIDSRRRVGVLEVRFDGGVSLKGTAVDLPLREAAPGTGEILGEGDPALDHDTVDFGASGLGRALLSRILDATGADVALVNYLALRGGLHGPIDLLDLEKALPFHNEVVLQTFDTPQLVRILDAGAKDDTRHLLVASRVSLPAPLPARTWRVATIDYLANGGRGGWGVFLEGRDRIRTRISLDDLALSLLKPTAASGGSP
jgi:hypothetical protein